jgi:hypothetical protein
MECTVCCCVYHVDTQLMKDAINRMQDYRLGIHILHDEQCECLVCYPPGSTGSSQCHATSICFAGTTKLWQSCVCLKGELDMWHKDWLTRNCVLCGVERKLKFCPLEIDLESPHLVK